MERSSELMPLVLIQYNICQLLTSLSFYTIDFHCLVCCKSTTKSLKLLYVF